MGRLGVPAAAEGTAFARLAARYRQPPRSYHTPAHARRVVAAVDELSPYADAGDAVRLAAWLHDVVYDPGAGDNEARSAAYAGQMLGGLALEPALIAEVERLIGLTATHQPEVGDRNGQVLADADLAILGAPPAEYAAYAQAIRREYAFVDEEAYRQGRLRIVRRFLARPKIYQTAAWHRKREPQARQNLRREIARLHV